MKIIIKNWSKIIFIISILAISSALIAEYFYNLIPCKMCLYQRYPYYFIIAIFIIFNFFKKNHLIFLYMLFELSIFYGLFYSGWHVGIERKIFKSPSGCANEFNDISSTAALKQQIVNQDIVNCSEVSWYILELSAASFNFLLLILLLFFNTMYLYKKLYAKEKKT
tara:strand:- start:39 stop:536 length:498 start_codon:yes stop_codon:yes gene_type:complete